MYNPSARGIRLNKITAAFLLLIFAAFAGQTSFAQKNPKIDEELSNKEEALERLGDRLPSIAAKYEKSPNELRRLLLEDNTLHVDKNDKLVYIDENAEEALIAAVDSTSAEPTVAAAAPYPYAQTFALHSRPGATRIIYLDFNGHTTSSTSPWNSYNNNQPIAAAPFDMDGNRSSFSAAEQDVIQAVWQRMAEDFAPFDVDVTTEDLGDAALIRTTSTDNNFGIRVVMTPTNFMGSGVGGVAYVGIYNSLNNANYQPAWVFSTTLGNTDKNIAEAASHEVGHTLGLNHDGTASAGYYSGHGVWAPIMGTGYTKSISQWSRGEYPGANNTEDDLSIMQSKGAVLLADDYADTTAAATALTGASVSRTGLITTRADVDVFKFTIGSGTISLNINPAPRGGNLDIKAQILDSAGNLIATSDPSSFTLSSTFPAGISASFNQFLSAGTYYLRIDGAGSAADDSSAGYSDYASLGQYSVSGTLPSGGTTPTNLPPTAVISPSANTGVAPATINFSSAGSSDPDGSIVSYNWNFGNGATSTAQNPTNVYNTAGTFTASLTVTDNSGASNTATALITVTNPVTNSVRTNVALASNGATATGSSVYSSSFSAAAAINGDRYNLYQSNGTYNLWHSATVTKPDWLQIDFAGGKTIDEINVVTLQDNYTSPVNPTETTTFSYHGLTNFNVQYWNGSAWVDVPGGTISGNNKVWRKFTFAAVTTTKIRVLVNAAADGYSRIMEVEAWSGGTTPTPTKTNFALASNGATATGSSVYSTSFSAAAAINGDRYNLYQSNGTYNLWHSATTAKPDWLQVDFAGGKTIDEINVVTLQDNYSSPVNPIETTTFAYYGITNFNVQYWNSSVWVDVPGGAVTGNNKVLRKFTFAAITTTKIRVLITASGDGYSRIMEVEALGN